MQVILYVPYIAYLLVVVAGNSKVERQKIFNESG